MSKQVELPELAVGYMDQGLGHGHYAIIIADTKQLLELRYPSASIPDSIVRACNSFEDLAKLLKVAKCPCCDGSGGYYNNDGQPTQCQWCDETKKAIAKAST